MQKANMLIFAINPVERPDKKLSLFDWKACLKKADAVWPKSHISKKSKSYKSREKSKNDWKENIKTKNKKHKKIFINTE